MLIRAGNVGSLGLGWTGWILLDAVRNKKRNSDQLSICVSATSLSLFFHGSPCRVMTSSVVVETSQMGAAMGLLPDRPGLPVSERNLSSERELDTATVLRRACYD
jgi:hypothetical protein